MLSSGFTGWKRENCISKIEADCDEGASDNPASTLLPSDSFSPLGSETPQCDTTNGLPSADTISLFDDEDPDRVGEVEGQHQSPFQRFTT